MKYNFPRLESPIIYPDVNNKELKVENVKLA